MEHLGRYWLFVQGMVVVVQNDRKCYDVPVRLWTMQISKMELIISTEPMDPVDMDFVKLEMTVDVKDV